MNVSPNAIDTASTMLTPIVNALQPWQSLYAEHKALATFVLFLHLAALVAAGGLAIAADRAVVRTSLQDSDERARRLSDLALTHRPVVLALVLSFISGALLLFADLEAFVVMPAFWVKMVLLLLLMWNALCMLRRERQLRALDSTLDGVAKPTAIALWKRLQRHAYASLGLWFAIVFAGTAMTSG